VSCIAGLFHRGGQAVDPRQIKAMLLPMRPRAPDGDLTRCDGPIGFGHSLLRTGTSKAEGTHALSLDGETWITADARIDRREELVCALRGRGRHVSEGEPHAALILHAYAVFEEGFIGHLIGDFAFAIWDARKQALICARDHFGVRPFHYFETAEAFGFASDADALLTQPHVTDALDDVALTDFLLFGALLDQDRSIYRDVRCLPPASILVVSRAGAQLRRYWELPRQLETRFSSRSEYVEEYATRFERAVSDRLPGGAVAMQLSGGIDSTAIAAVAAARSRKTATPVLAYTLGCSNVPPHEEEWPFAQVAASSLSIPLLRQDLAHFSLFQRCTAPAPRIAAPQIYPFLAAQQEIFNRLAVSGAKVLLSGQGGDAVLAPSAPYYAYLLRERRFSKLANEVWHHVRFTASFGGMGLRSALLARSPTQKARPPAPDWIHSDLAARVDIKARWDRGWTLLHGISDPQAQLRESWLCRQFEPLEALKLPMIARYPFFDLRLVEFCLGLPNFMRSGKVIARAAMHSKLPEAIRLRPKTPLRTDFIRSAVTCSNISESISDPQWNAAVNGPLYWRALERYRNGEGAESPWTSSLSITPLALSSWLMQRPDGDTV
jgi:asparagine synthase (glutamine-hydrolysing)